MTAMNGFNEAFSCATQDYGCRLCSFIVFKEDLVICRVTCDI